MAIYKWTTEPKKIYLWTPTDDYSAMQWPCPDGFHIPKKSEREVVRSYMASYSYDTWPHTRTYLRMPFAWDRSNSDWTVGYKNETWYYRCSTATASGSWHVLYLYSSGIAYGNYLTSYWFSIRPFKDTPVIPDETRTMKVSTWDSSWIYWNETLWLISISAYHWTERITMSDKNLWATTPFTYWDILSQTNCWYYYQRWNNYWFAWTWSISTASWQVNASTYWPWNYYSNSIFRTNSSSGRDSSSNTDLRWWETWITQKGLVKKVYMWKEPYTDYSAMRWPCDNGFHVPTKDEWTAVYNAWISLGALTAASYVWASTYLKMPLPWWRRGDTAATQLQWDRGYYWTCTVYDNYKAYIFYLTTGSWSQCLVTWDTNVSTWNPVRPFKDMAVVPDSSWTVLYQWTWDAWVYRNSTLWLISLSSDGTTWYTIADKNSWATTVYNYGDALSEANCWKYYQLGNNYGFPFTWSVTTSSTEVDASSYSPSTYSSSTFITTWSWSWDSSRNPDLWGWVTWTTSWWWDILIRPIIPATAISLNQSSITLTTVWQTSQLTATLTPADSTSTVTWSSSNTSIATVSQSWLVTCVTPWSATITATANGHSATCNVQSILTTTDILYNGYRGTTWATNYYYGVKFTALKSWSIKKVSFMYPNAHTWTLKIAAWNYATASGTTYTLTTSNTPSWVYTLDTPFQITAGNNYSVSIASSNWWYESSWVTYPVTWTAVKYDYGTSSINNNQLTSMYYAIKSLTIDYVP